MPNIVVRLLTGFIGAPLILAIVYLAPFVGYYALAGGAMTVAAWEFFGMTHHDDPTGRRVGTGLTVALFCALVYARFGHAHPTVALWAALLLAPIALLFALARPAHIPNALHRTAALVFGPLYLAATMGALAVLRTVGTSREGAGLVVLALCCAWGSDTAAYFAGKSIGGPKLYPVVSPNKTWSGAIGGLVMTMLAAVLAHYTFLPTLPLVPGVLVAGLAGAAGQMGDLAESVLKRSAGVKDSGGILPGHGGILDRIDALVFSALVVFGAVETGLLQLTR
jgi:phosphatidate cytidylyltransferase